MIARPGEIRSLKTLEYVLGADPAVVRGFARAAADRLEQGPLTLDARDRLLRRGERLGIRRFDANLVVAAVEHRRRTLSPMTIPQSSRPKLTGPRLAALTPPARRRFLWPTAATAMAVQGLIVTAAWWLLA